MFLVHFCALQLIAMLAIIRFLFHFSSARAQHLDVRTKFRPKVCLLLANLVNKLGTEHSNIVPGTLTHSKSDMTVNWITYLCHYKLASTTSNHRTYHQSRFLV